MQDSFAKILKAVSDQLQQELDKPLPPGLYLTATPIGNLSDVTFRAVAVLARADSVYCEDTRHSRILLDRFGIKRRLHRYDDHARDNDRERILGEIGEGKAVALISDAGTPLVSDPGYKLVRAAIQQGIRVTGLPGASAVTNALILSGLPSTPFLFDGFLPNKSHARQMRLQDLSTVPASLIFYEAPQRLAASLADMAVCLGNRPVAILREMTKRFEEVRTGTVETLSEQIGREAQPKGEVVIVLGPPKEAEPPGDQELLRAIEAELNDQSFRDAVQAVAERFALPRKEVYKLGLSLKRDTK